MAPESDTGVCFGVRAEDWLTTRWVIEVDEAKVYATGSVAGSAWWTTFRRTDDTADQLGLGRCRVATTSPAGDLVHVAADDHDHARWLHQTMLAAGLPASAVTPRRMIGDPR